MTGQGWYALESDRFGQFRWMGETAQMSFAASSPWRSLKIEARFVAQVDRPCCVSLMGPADELVHSELLWPRDDYWHSWTIRPAQRIPAGTFSLHFEALDTWTETSGRTISLAVREVSLR